MSPGGRNALARFERGNEKKEIRICLHCSYSITDDGRCKCGVGCSNAEELLAKVLALGGALKSERLKGAVRDQKYDKLRDALRAFIGPLS